MPGLHVAAPETSACTHHTIVCHVLDESTVVCLILILRLAAGQYACVPNSKHSQHQTSTSVLHLHLAYNNTLVPQSVTPHMACHKAYDLINSAFNTQVNHTRPKLRNECCS